MIVRSEVQLQQHVMSPILLEVFINKTKNYQLVQNCCYVTEQFVEKSESPLGHPNKLIFDDSPRIIMTEVVLTPPDELKLWRLNQD